MGIFRFEEENEVDHQNKCYFIIFHFGENEYLKIKMKATIVDVLNKYLFLFIFAFIC